jgi:hypothetical protein
VGSRGAASSRPHLIVLLEESVSRPNLLGRLIVMEVPIMAWDKARRRNFAFEAESLPNGLTASGITYSVGRRQL